MGKKKDRYEFIWDAIQKHGYKYDYRKVDYKGNKINVCIICPKHGEFYVRANCHLNGCICSKCSHEKTRLVESDVINYFKKAHGDKYDYSKVKYEGNDKKVCIICPIHGEFWQTPHSHSYGQGCPKCAVTYQPTTEEFIEKAKKIHNNKYDYSKVNYKGNKAKVCVICKKHGEFWQTPHSHLSGHGCAKCVNKYVTTEEFVEKAKLVHKDKYDYSKVEYVEQYEKVCIICPKHGEFYQTPKLHLHGHGCQICNESKMEKHIKAFLCELTIRFESQKHFEWLGRQSLDFYLPGYNIAIECQGEQHFRPINYFGGDKKLAYVKQMDKRKLKLCTDNSVKLIYINYFDSEEEINNKLSF